jgi:SAM-dependent methyltransferase
MMTRQVEKLLNATSPGKLKRELEQLERGGIFHELGITNFLEGDLFSWYLSVWTEPIQKIIWKMINKLDEYNPVTISEEPEKSRDLLKKLYQQLFPKSVRHDLGEYYTPDWLAEHVLNELGYEGDPDKRLLDPACGSGTFLVMAINRIRRWYDLNREKCAYDEGELLKKILANVIGFDLNPLAVMAARTNYLVAIKDLIRHVEAVEIPVYLCDSIMTPAEYGDLFTRGQGKVAKVPCSAMKPPHLLVPKEIARSPEDVAKYALILETCVKNAYAPDEFLSRCRDDGLIISATDAHLDLYKELVKLDKANKNGIWARIIKNNFAPLFVGRVDYVAGNPPWITWESLPTEYRKDTYRVFEGYNLFPHTGMRARMAGANVDLSIAMTYVAADSFLRVGGRLGFVITQSVFQSSGGDGFRFFRVGNTPLQVKTVSDMVAMNPFEGAANRTATFVFEVGKETTYPVPYAVWRPESGPVNSDMTLEAVYRSVIVSRDEARPVKPTVANSPWQISSGKMEASVLDKVSGRSDYVARKGVSTSANAVYWVEFISQGPKGTLLVRNITAGAKRKVEGKTFAVESDIVHPLLRGKDCTKWVTSPQVFILFPHESGRGIHAIPEAILKQRFPLTYAYFKDHHALLSERKEYQKFLEPQGDPFYALYPVREYTFSEYKVAFREISTTFQAVVLHQAPMPDGTSCMVVPDHKLVIIPCSAKEEAHYLCGVLNSAPFGRFAMAYSVGTQISTHLLTNANVPLFDPRDELHQTLAKLSASCHEIAAKGDVERLAGLEAKIDKAGAKLWGIKDDELKAIQKALEEAGKSKGKAKEDGEE